MPPSYPTRRPTDAAHLSTEQFDPPTSLLNLPWIDSHTHAQTLSWADRERYSLAGCRAMVMVASGYHWTPYKPVAAEDVRFLWDDAINRRRAIERNHFFEASLALGIHTGVPVENPEDLLDAMTEYTRLDEVAAIGETGITPTQHVRSWNLEDQFEAVRTQIELAKEENLPVILHTPNSGPDAEPNYRPGVGTPGYETNPSLVEEPVISGDNPALEAVELDFEAARDAGVADERVVASHADPNNVEYLLGDTGCYASFTLGYPWLTGVTAADVADAIREYGPDQIMVETDCANILETDVFSIKRAILELYRLGIEIDEIRQVVFENPRRVFGIAE